MSDIESITAEEAVAMLQKKESRDIQKDERGLAVFLTFFLLWPMANFIFAFFILCAGFITIFFYESKLEGFLRFIASVALMLLAMALFYGPHRFFDSSNDFLIIGGFLLSVVIFYVSIRNLFKGIYRQKREKAKLLHKAGFVLNPYA
jgi:hypothetical protein